MEFSRFAHVLNLLISGLTKFRLIVFTIFALWIQYTKSEYLTLIVIEKLKENQNDSLIDNKTRVEVDFTKPIVRHYGDNKSVRKSSPFLN